MKLKTLWLVMLLSVLSCNKYDKARVWYVKHLQAICGEGQFYSHDAEVKIRRTWSGRIEFISVLGSQSDYGFSFDADGKLIDFSSPNSLLIRQELTPAQDARVYSNEQLCARASAVIANLGFSNDFFVDKTKTKDGSPSDKRSRSYELWFYRQHKGMNIEDRYVQMQIDRCTSDVLSIYFFDKPFKTIQDHQYNVEQAKKSAMEKITEAAKKFSIPDTRLEIDEKTYYKSPIDKQEYSTISGFYEFTVYLKADGQPGAKRKHFVTVIVDGITGIAEYGKFTMPDKTSSHRWPNPMEMPS